MSRPELYWGTIPLVPRVKANSLEFEYDTFGDVSDGAAHSVIRGMKEDAAGNLWVASHGGLQIFQNEKCFFDFR